MTRGTTEVSPTSSKTYTLICTTAGVSGSDAVTVEVTSLAEPPVISIFTADPEVISAGEITTVTWESTEATQCTGAQFSTDGAVGGSQDVAPANTTTYQLSCSGPGGTVTDSVTVTVVPKPVASIAADPPVIQPGESSELTWTSSHADFCVGTGFSTGAGQTTSGSVIVSPTVTTTYLVTCTGELENDADSVEIIVGVPNISIEVLTDSFPFVPYNGVTDIRWESTDTQSCVLTGPGVSATGTSGETTSQPITGKTTFTLVCQTAFGPVSTSTTIFNPPRPHEI
jgi:3D (Asp-Asp-Asp) domain-containing protein